jgi:CDP-diacylglycerol--serine O-phosphatidyltransferase
MIKPSRAWAPNALTMGNLLFGFLAILVATQSAVPYEIAAWMLFVAAWFDVFDGGVARLLGVNSQFGKELDSLADVVTFVVAPAVLIYRFSFHLLGWTGVVFVAFYVCCAVGRLARYNSQSSHHIKNQFTGMPVNIASVTACTTVYTLGESYVWPAALLLALTGWLMIGSIPFPTPGQILFEAPLVVRVALAALWIVALLRFETWFLMPLSYLGYVLLQSGLPALRPASLRKSALAEVTNEP